MIDRPAAVTGPAEAMRLLIEGNLRFVSGNRDRSRGAGGSHRRELASGQRPFAAVLGCSDSRVPVEILFDRGAGDLFVVRVAGNTAGPSQVASVEFAVEYLGTRLVVVLGHTGCGAVGAAVDALLGTSRSPENLSPLLDLIRPSVESAMAAGGDADRDGLVRLSTRESVRRSVRTLAEGSDIIRGLSSDGGLVVTGAEYSLETGRVAFLD